ncbi:ATP-binding protein [Geothrix terrae]|uniref:hybrid sensor histidine kinase/response regulator n=1 Tax=Geothrix terrae TaxID=2922720 RepID=UPI001FACEA2F|nr:ATP-binding protein [Geothrix terrae]
MQPPPLPPDEAFRLEVVRSLGLLDTPGEERFDRIARAAARFFRAPVAFVALVDATRLWLKARQGLDQVEAPRDLSFCGHAILAWEPFVVEDARLDARFADNPLVAGPPFIRFYAGMPLRGPGNALVGTLCVIDRAPRVFSRSDRDYLLDMAAWAELELIHPPAGAGDPVGPAEPAAPAPEALEREAHLKLMLQALPDFLFRQDRQGTYLEVVARSTDDLVKPPEQLLGHTISEVLPPGEAMAFLKGIGEVLDTGETRTIEYRLTLDGRGEDFEARIVPCEPGQVLSIVRNISTRREHERMQERFLRTVIHELRTPLSSIRSSLELMLEQERADGLSGKAREFAAMAHTNTVRLARIVDDILGQAKRGYLSVSLRRCDLQALARQAVEMVQAYSDSFGVHLPLHLCPQEAEVHADPDRVIQILVNLLSNAVKYSPPGESVVTRVRPSGTGWAVEVEDHGPGIPAAFQPRVFQEFSQAGGPHQQPGSGLGLSISRSFAQSMGGALAFESKPGRTVFCLELPVPPSLSGPVGEGSGQLAAVLHVEDDDVVSELLASALEGVARVDHVSTLEAARQRIPEGRWGLAVLDGMLPDGAGADLLPLLREAYGADFPVVLYTGDSQSVESDGEFIHVLLKGHCGPDEIRRVVQGALERRPRG